MVRDSIEEITPYAITDMFDYHMEKNRIKYYLTQRKPISRIVDSLPYYKIPIEWNKAKNNELYATTKTFTSNYKKKVISSYSSSCIIKNCYNCSQRSGEHPTHPNRTAQASRRDRAHLAALQRRPHRTARQDRIAGAILITDGQVHDVEVLPGFDAPVHVVLTGQPNEWDLRLVIETAPAFAIVGEPVELTLRVEALGRAPNASLGTAPLYLSLNGDDPVEFEVPVGETVTIPMELARGGMNVLQLSLDAVADELTDRNNSAIVSINGIRDRLRVLLVSGEPYAGERTWRNLLKADSSVDLVHFTILRPPEKQDGVPVFELSLIAFPHRELFMPKIIARILCHTSHPIGR